jgi:hypothetical protein
MHLVHGGKRFAHLDDALQQFKGKVAHTNAPTGRETRNG